MRFLDQAMEEGLARDVKGREAYLYIDKIYWVLCLFWLDLDKRLH